MPQTHNTTSYAVVASILASSILPFNPTTNEGNNVTLPKSFTFSTAPYNLATLDYAILDSRLQRVQLSAVKRDFPIPDSFVNERGIKVLKFIESSESKLLFLNPLEDGGLMIEFENSGKYFLVEIANNNEMILLKRGDTSEAVDLTPTNFINEIQSSLKDA